MTATPNIVELRPKITVIGLGGGGGNAVNNMIAQNLEGAEFIVANTDVQALAMSRASRLIQLGANVTKGLGAGCLPEVGHAAAEESIDEIMDHLTGTHMCFVTAGMGGGTGTGVAPVIAQAARQAGILKKALSGGKNGAPGQFPSPVGRHPHSTRVCDSRTGCRPDDIDEIP